MALVMFQGGLLFNSQVNAIQSNTGDISRIEAESREFRQAVKTELKYIEAVIVRIEERVTKPSDGGR